MEPPAPIKGPPDVAILHISDIHRTPDEPVSSAEVLQWLLADLDSHREEQIPAPQIIVVTGDIAQAAEPTQYDEAKTFLVGLLEHLKLSRDRLVIVPGNHDIHRPTSEGFVRRRSIPRSVVEKELAYTFGGAAYTYESDDAFQARLDNFRTFYREMCGQSYPTSRKTAFTQHHFADFRLNVFGISSLETIDNDRVTPSFNSDTVLAASRAAEALGQRSIAVWHHDLDWEQGSTDCLPADDLKLLSAGPFSLGLCGHRHRAASNEVARIRGYSLPVVAAGSLCAGAAARPESTGRSYNVILVRAKKARVWVRVKDTKGGKWQDLCVFGTPRDRRSWYDVDLDADPELGLTEDALTRRPRELRSPNPFSNVNAKASSRSRVLADYVWTRVADDAQIELPQIVVGTRGSGKTALLFTLTLEAQLKKLDSHNSPLPVVGLYCPMKVNEVSAFNGKGALSLETRKTLFRAALATMWSTELVDALLSFSRWIAEKTGTAMPEADVVHALSNAWGVRPEQNTLTALRATVRGLRDLVLRCLSSTGSQHFESSFEEIIRVSLLRGGLGPLDDAARELQRWESFRSTRWTVLFDEVEFLNVWQQECVYQHMSNPSSNTSSKVATLPYAHSRALSEFPAVLVLGEDYGELSLVLGEDTDFERVAKGLWQSRLSDKNGPSLEEIWPEEEYRLVVARAIPEITSDADLDDRLIEDLPVARRSSAKALKATNPSKFGDQFRRKYQQPFRFRLANRQLRENGITVPLYWGWRQMLKACGTNPRQFLLLAEMCWTNYWAAGGLRPLSAAEQYAALKQWASAFSARCASLPHKGHDLQEIISRVAEKLRGKLYNSMSLRNEQLSVKIEDCDQGQAEAIAIGIAYGFLVPKLTADAAGRAMFPASDIVMRLGYPVAIANDLPLRQGEVLKILTMRQLELSWWNE